ncbi:MAG: glycosyltransferase family 4 protein [Candidatus Sericytochromatia bacterium]|nr:glycosyltransferase family 4 protein [Candidatus Sericytochromatia bacterium]
MKNNLKVAWIGKKSPFCGNVTYSREITNLLTTKGHEVFFFHFAEEYSHEESDPVQENEVLLPYLYKAQSYTVPSVKSVKVLRDALKEINPDIVHVSLCLSPLDFILPEICHELGIPIVCTFHNAFDKRPTFHGSASFIVYQLYAPSLAQYDGVIIFSEVQKELLCKMNVPRDIIKVIPNGIDTNRFTPGVSEFRNKFPNKQIYTYLGRINPEKGLEDMLKAFTRASGLDDVQLVIVGGGSQENVLKSIFGEEPNITWTGVIKDENIRIDILRGTDAFILPSQIEGLSLSLLEAMACGAPIVATDVGADGEVLEDGAGIIIDPLKVKSHLGFALKILHDSKDYRDLLSKKARQRVVDRYSLEKNVSTVEELYFHCLEKSNSNKYQVSK